MLCLWIFQVLTIDMSPEGTETGFGQEKPQDAGASLPSPSVPGQEGEPEIAMEEALEVVRAVAAKNPH